MFCKLNYNLDEFGVWNVECGVLVEWIGSENTKVLCPNLFICGVAAGLDFVFLTNVGNGLDRSDYL